MSTVSGILYTKDEANGGLQSYDVWVPDDLANQLSDIADGGWVSLALQGHPLLSAHQDEYICLRSKDILYFRREMTAAEKQRKHTLSE